VLISTETVDLLPSESKAWSFLPLVIKRRGSLNQPALLIYAYAKGILPSSKAKHSSSEVAGTSVLDYIDSLIPLEKLPHSQVKDLKKADRFFLNPVSGKPLAKRVYIVPWDGWAGEDNLITHYFQENGAKVEELSLKLLDKTSKQTGVVLFHQTFPLTLMRRIPNFASILGESFSVFRIGTDKTTNQFESTRLFTFGGAAVCVMPEVYKNYPRQGAHILLNFVDKNENKPAHQRYWKIVGRKTMLTGIEGGCRYDDIDLNLNLLLDLVKGSKGRNDPRVE
jgi:hypothetical protein